MGRQQALPVVDLHDLNRRCARDATQAVCAIGADLEAGAVRFVTGRGRHSLGAGGVLVHTVRKELQKTCAETGWRFRGGGAGWILITDEERAPRSAKGELGPMFWLLAALFGVAATIAVAHQLGAF